MDHFPSESELPLWTSLLSLHEALQQKVTCHKILICRESNLGRHFDNSGFDSQEIVEIAHDLCAGSPQSATIVSCGIILIFEVFKYVSGKCSGAACISRR